MDETPARARVTPAASVQTRPADNQRGVRRGESRRGQRRGGQDGQAPGGYQPAAGRLRGDDRLSVRGGGVVQREGGVGSGGRVWVSDRRREGRSGGLDKGGLGFVRGGSREGFGRFGCASSGVMYQ